MIKHVSPGDEITAEGFNSLVDAVGGPDIPSQKGFLKTANGAIFTEWSNLDAQANMRVTDVFKCAIGPAIKTITSTGPWNNWKNPSGSETQSTEKHLYMYLGSDNLGISDILNIEKNPFLNFRGVPPKFIAWSIGKYHHIVGDIDFYVNNPNSDFNEYGKYLHDDEELGVAPYIYHGWIETPFQPTPDLKLYGSFYKLLDSSGEGEFTGTIFIITCSGFQNIDGENEKRCPIHSFTTFTGPNGENFIVGEQCTTPVLICEMQEAQAMPGDVDETMESSKLVQHHTGPLFYAQDEQEAQGAWSILNFVSENENGDDIVIDSYFEMKISYMSGKRQPVFPDFEIITNVSGKNYLCLNNFQVSGKQVIIELDSSTPVRYGILSRNDFPEESETALPFVNICKRKMGFYDKTVIDLYDYEAYLVIPNKLNGQATENGIFIVDECLRGVFTWHDTLKCWELLIIQGGRIGQASLNDVFLAECIFDGTGTYTWFVPRNAIFQGSFSNLTRDWNIGDTQLGTEAVSANPIVEKLTYNASIDACNILSAVDENGRIIYEGNADFYKLLDTHPFGLQLFRFDKMNYTTPLSVGLASADISAEWIDNMDVVVRHRHFDQNNNKDGFKGSVVKYVPIKDLLSEKISTNINVDTKYYGNPFQRSIDEVSNALQLYSFDNNEADLCAAYNLRFEDDTRPNPPTEGGLGRIDFVMRNRGSNGREVGYQTGELKVPHERLDSDSIGYQSLAYKQSGLQNMPKELQLYKFDDMTTCSPSSLTGGEGIVIRRMNATDVFVDYMEASALSNFVPVAPNLSALNNLSIVTGIEYPMTGENQYKIVAHRKEMSIVDNTLVLTDLPDQTIDTIPHSEVI